MVEEMNANATPTQDPEAAFEARLKAAKEIADKHGYYYSVLSDEEKVEYALALSGEGFEQEIALLKAKMKCMMLLYPYNMALMARILSILERLQKTQKALFNKDSATELEAAVEKVFIKLHIPLELMGNGLKPAPGAA